jgi:CheY-like chemotaxis protein/AraC-like DNA-binding protein
MVARRAASVILVVDDEVDVRETIGLLLQEEFDVLEAADGPSAVALAHTAPIDLALLDIRMPGMDGLATLTELRRARPGLPVVVVSGVDRATTAVMALRNGAADYLTKPFEIETLLKTVREALGRQSGLATPGARPTVACVGCHVSVVAGLAATLAPGIEVQSHADPPPAGTLAPVGVPSVLIVDTRGRPGDWIGQVGLLADRLQDVPGIALVDAGNALEVRFALGEDFVLVESPARLARLLDLVCTATRDAPARRPWREPRMARLIEEVCGEYAEFSLRRLARRLGVSPYYLSRQFRVHAGLKLNAYLRLVRVYAARYLLDHTDMKVEAVAAAVGFHDASHMSDAFHEVTGRRPGRHRAGQRTAGNGGGGLELRDP